MANVIWLSCDYHVPGCLSFTFSFPIKFWCMGMFWWIQPNKHRSAVCSCHANYNHSEGYGRQGNADLSKQTTELVEASIAIKVWQNMVLFSMKVNCKLKYDCLTYLYWNITLSVELLLCTCTIYLSSIVSNFFHEKSNTCIDTNECQ